MTDRSPKDTAKSALADTLLREGFCVVPDVLTPDMVAALSAATDRVIDAMDTQERERTGNQGIVFQMIYQEPAFQQLIAWPAALAALAGLGFSSPRYWSGYIVCKEPHTPAATYWHQDWPFWDESISREIEPCQTFLMYYLSDTTIDNGCLRVIPRTHMKRIPLHDQIGAHDDNTTRFADPATSPAYANHPEQINVEVKAGDLVVGDARLLHSANGNNTESRRSNLVLWFLPRYDQMPDALKAACQARLFVPPPVSLPEQERVLIEPLLPDYDGDATPSRWNRVPGEHLLA